MTGYEEAILQSRCLPRDDRGLWAGICRVTRLSRHYADQQSRTIWDTGADLIGPTFFFFIWWVIRMAAQEKIKTLYFLARDGQVLIQIARLIVERYPTNTEFKYLYGSRQAWLIPSIREFGQKEMDWVMSDWWYRVSIRSICKRLGLSPEDMNEILNQFRFAKNDFDRTLNNEEKSRLKDCLRSEIFQCWFQQRSKEDFENTVGYFRQEGLLKEECYGLVDIGWRGNQQVALNKILQKAGCQPKKGITGFYFGLTEAVEKCAGDTLQAFLFDLSSSSRRFQLRNNHLYEAFAASEEGRTIGFGKKANQFYPILESPVNQPVVDWGIQIQQESILHFCQKFLAHCPSETFREEYCFPVLERLLDQFISRPSVSEAEVYGRFPMDGEMTESNVQEIAPVVSRKDFWLACLDLKNFHFFWVQASLLRSKLYFEKFLWKLVLPFLTVSYFWLQRILRLRQEHREHASSG